MNIVITAGGTSEYIDKVRKITNSGTGALGALIADEVAERQDVKKIFYICSKKAVTPKTPKAKIIRITTTADLKTAVEQTFADHNINWFIHSMAVSDYYVDFVSTAEMLAKDITAETYVHGTPMETIIKNPYSRLDNSDKLSSSEDNLIIVLKQTPKVIGLIKQLSPKTHLIGFKLLENVTKKHLLAVAAKLRDKNGCDYVVANDLHDIKNGLHTAYLLKKDNTFETLHGKPDIAHVISHVIK